MKTTKNLQEAFAGESQANRRYLAYGDAAAKEGLPQVVKLFRAVAAAETIHAHAHLRAMGGIKATAENLVDAIAGEKHEFEEMYPAFVADAGAEGQRQAATSMKHAMAVEKTRTFTGNGSTLQGNSRRVSRCVPRSMRSTMPPSAAAVRRRTLG